MRPDTLLIFMINYYYSVIIAWKNSNIYAGFIKFYIACTLSERDNKLFRDIEKLAKKWFTFSSILLC